MTREEQIIEAGAYHLGRCRPPKTCGHNMHELAYMARNLAFEAGAKWADENPKDGTVSLDKVVDEFRHFITDHFSNLFRTGEEVKMITDLFKKRLEE